ncbi:MAG: carotenoid biosynthesis protein, partial [Cytophagia bacterium]|nr:carotenoid biosynthesis protein [Cytophagia bacterium]
NWAVVVLGAHALAQLIVSSKFWPAVLKKTWLSLILAAGLATLFDYLLEPVAIYLNFWQWEAGVIPMLNYISWFGVSLAALLLVERFNTGENKMAAIVLLAQTIFLVGITLLFR